MSDSTKYGKTLPEFQLSENFTNEFEYLVSLINQKRILIIKYLFCFF